VKNSFRFFLIGCISFLILSCQNDIPKQPGICLSFDDNYLEQWVGILPLLEKYDAKVTFFVTGVGRLNDQEKIWLNQIREAGHEIGAHGEQHLSMNSYIRENGLRSYWKKEIREHLDSFQKLGIQPKVFAYPFGEKNHYIDILLFSQFKATRNVAAFSGEIGNINSIYHTPGTFQKRFHSLGVDNIENIKLEELELAFEKTKENNKVIFLHAHGVGDNFDYEISIFMLEKIIQSVLERDMRFYTYSDLTH
jgi:peptidoglycan-N-acetylglucosamine deacetylase